MSAALVIAHPGHELRSFGWACETRPLTFVLTHGDGSDRSSRLASTSRVLADAGAQPGCIYGQFTDRMLYDLVLQQRYDVLCELRDDMATAFVDAGISLVVCDAVEWYNPSHDLCQYLAVSAARLASARTGRPIRIYDVPLIAAPDTCPDDLRPEAIVVHLDDAVFQRKIAHARLYTELQLEVERALAANGAEAFRLECLRPVTGSFSAPASQPFYELYGEQRVQAGQYRDVIRFDPHLLGAQRALECVGTEVPGPCVS